MFETALCFGAPFFRMNPEVWDILIPKPGRDMAEMKKYLVVCMAAAAMMFSLMVGMEQLFQQRLRETMETMAPTKETVAEKQQSEIYALFGVDAPEGQGGRSDCIMLLSFEEDSGTLRMCSIARDTMVTVPGQEKPTKLCHAYAIGGPEKAMETLNENFDLNITHYTAVNFTQMAELVDAMGGVSVSLSGAEWNYLGFDKPYLGARRLSGEEALRYCRIRSIDSDDVRTGRQRKLISAMLGQLRDVPRSELPTLVMEGMEMCSTNIGFYPLLRMGKAVLTDPDGIETVSMALPGDAVSAWGGVREDGVWYYVYDLAQAASAIEEFFLGADACTVDGKI